MASHVTGEFDMTSIDHGNAFDMRRTCTADPAVANKCRFAPYTGGAISLRAFFRRS
jgi:hypothetical protein